MPKRKAKMISLASTLKLPLDAVTQTFGFMARRGAGKTYCAQKLAEGMLEQGAQIIALDPIGNWWSLRLAANGKSPGFDIPVFGGLHGDLPLEPAAGQLVADVVADTGTSVVLDVSQFRKGERKRFVADFCERLFMRRKRDPSATHLFLEEAQAFCPQRVQKDDTRMVGAVEDIVRMGRNHGLGATMISQRPQSVNKEVLNQVECLVILQINGAQERKAIEQWVTYQGIDAAEMVKQLPSLKVGEAFVWSPQWLDILKRVKIGKKTTYDASATPTVGSKGRTKKIQPLNMAAVQKAMATVVEDQKANDPRELKKRIRTLERELGQKKPDDSKQVKRLRDELSDMRAQRDAIAGQQASLQRGLSKVQKALIASENAVSDSQKALESVVSELEASSKTALEASSRRRPTQAEPRVAPTTPAAPRSSPSNGVARQGRSSGTMGAGAEGRLLSVLVQHPDGIAKKKAAMLAKIPIKSSTLRGVLADLRKAGLEVKEGDTLKPTQLALDEYEDKVDPLPEGKELRAFYLNEVGAASAPGRLLKAAFDAWPNDLEKEEAAEIAEIPIESSTLRGALAILRRLEVINKAKKIKACDHLFD